jgi:hypothetical protein
LPGMPQTADFCEPASNLLAYCAVTAAIRMPMVAPTIAQIANTHQWIRCRGVVKSAGSADPVFTSMNPLLYEA